MTKTLILRHYCKDGTPVPELDTVGVTNLRLGNFATPGFNNLFFEYEREGVTHRASIHGTYYMAAIDESGNKVDNSSLPYFTDPLSCSL